jgi:hypothetical protein
MLKRNNFYLLILAQIFFLFFIFIIIPSIFLIEKSDISHTSFEDILSLDLKHIYIQKIISDHNNLNSVSVLLKNPALKSTDQVKLELQNNNQQPIQSLNISGQGIEDPGWVKLKFSPLSSQKGDIFYLKITSNAKNDNDLYIYGDKNNQNLNFKATYKSTNLVDSIKDNFAYQKDKFLKLNQFQNYFYLTILVFVNILVFFSL